MWNDLSLKREAALARKRTRRRSHIQQTKTAVSYLIELLFVEDRGREELRKLLRVGIRDHLRISSLVCALCINFIFGFNNFKIAIARSVSSILTMGKVPNIKFYNGTEIPILGLGTWKSQPGEVTQAVKDAIDIGYRHIDGAYIYENEKEVGEAIRAKIQEGLIKREDIFLTSKLWNTVHRPEAVEPALRKTLKDLGVDYVDLYLMHWPIAYKEGSQDHPTDENGNIQFADYDYVDTWKAMEKVCEKGLTKNIGVSNFNEEQLERVLKVGKIKPVNNQVECQPYLTQIKLSDYCKSKGITVTAYCPLGCPDRPWAKPGDPKLLDDPKITSIAKKYGKTAAQVVLHYQVQRGHIVIPKSVNRSRIEENFNIFDFELSEKDIELINSFDHDGRICALLECVDSPYYPFKK